MEDEIALRLGSVLTKIRNKRGLNREVFSRIICVSKDAYAKYEAGLRKPRYLVTWIESTIRLVNENSKEFGYEKLDPDEISHLLRVSRIFVGKPLSELPESIGTTVQSVEIVDEADVRSWWRSRPVYSRVFYRLSDDKKTTLDMLLEELACQQVSELTETPFRIIRRHLQKVYGLFLDNARFNYGILTVTEDEFVNMYIKWPIIFFYLMMAEQLHNDPKDAQGRRLDITDLPLRSVLRWLVEVVGWEVVEESEDDGTFTIGWRGDL
jgi:transcriptional regulator with XRE-family HTH domain